MVFGALIEYACVGYTAKRIQLRKNRSVVLPQIISNYENKHFRFLAMQKLAEEKKAEALKQMNSLPQVELDLKRHGPDGYHGCRDARGMPQNSMPRQHPKQVGDCGILGNINYRILTAVRQQCQCVGTLWLNWLLLCLV